MNTHDIADQLKNADLKVTQARIGVLELLHSTSTPSDVQDILDYLRKQDISADQATVYRILKVFVENDLVRQVEFNEGKVRYELASLPHHHHVVCVKCGSVRDIEECDVDEIAAKASKKLSFKIQSHNLEFFGLCRNCQH
jgi:Fur family ferric uptake transcriptional regulator